LTQAQAEIKQKQKALYLCGDFPQKGNLWIKKKPQDEGNINYRAGVLFDQVLATRATDHVSAGRCLKMKSVCDISYFIYLFIFLGFELSASCMLGRCSITWATPPALCCVGFFEIGSWDLFVWTSFEPWASWSLPPE
jgi:hypothetical protein